jgi:hypothetical protein
LHPTDKMSASGRNLQPAAAQMRGGCTRTFRQHPPAVDTVAPPSSPIAVAARGAGHLRARGQLGPRAGGHPRGPGFPADPGPWWLHGQDGSSLDWAFLRGSRRRLDFAGVGPPSAVTYANREPRGYHILRVSFAPLRGATSQAELGHRYGPAAGQYESVLGASSTDGSWRMLQMREAGDLSAMYACPSSYGLMPRTSFGHQRHRVADILGHRGSAPTASPAAGAHRCGYDPPPAACRCWLARARPATRTPGLIPRQLRPAFRLRRRSPAS